jgi:hypothetical protein
MSRALNHVLQHDDFGPNSALETQFGNFILMA